MAIAANEIVPYYAANRSKTDPAANGGRPANVPVSNSVEGNVWPSLTTAQRTAGQTICEKVFFKNRNAANESGDSPWLALGSPNPSGDHEWIVAADQDNLQSALTGSERRYTASKLATDATAGSNTLVLTLDDAGLANAYQDGDSVIIYSGRNSMWADGGHQERATISGAPQASGTQLTLTLAAVLTHSHPAATGVCCSLCTSVTPFAPRIDNVSQSGTGSYDLAGHPIELGNLGAVRQRWTLTYNGTRQATLSGDTMGSLGVFAIASDIAPINPASGTPYLTIKAAGHGSAHVSGDILAFDTYEAALACYWYKATPAGTDAMGLTVSRLVCGCES